MTPAGDGPAECVINISEGRDRSVIDAVAAAGGDRLLDVHSDAEHHRSVLTLVGDLPDVEAAARQVAAAAVAAIDLTDPPWGPPPARRRRRRPLRPARAARRNDHPVGRRARRPGRVRPLAGRLARRALLPLRPGTHAARGPARRVRHPGPRCRPAGAPSDGRGLRRRRPRRPDRLQRLDPGRRRLPSRGRPRRGRRPPTRRRAATTRAAHPGSGRRRRGPGQLQRGRRRPRSPWSRSTTPCAAGAAARGCPVWKGELVGPRARTGAHRRTAELDGPNSAYGPRTQSNSASAPDRG